MPSPASARSAKAKVVIRLLKGEPAQDLATELSIPLEQVLAWQEEARLESTATTTGRPFLSIGRREFLQLGMLGVLVGGGLTCKRWFLDPVPSPSTWLDAALELPAPEHLPSGHFVYAQEYSLDFVQDYLDFFARLNEWLPMQTIRQLLAHPFPVKKYQATWERLVDAGVATDAARIPPAALDSDDLAMVHSRGHLLDLYLSGQSYVGLLNAESPNFPEMLDYVTLASGGTYAAALAALNTGWAMNINGGFHHAHADHIAGFCYINDVAISIARLRRHRLVNKVMLIDLDVHHGHGNAAVLAGDPSSVIMDIYSENNYPARKYPVAYAFPLAPSGACPMIDDSAYMEALNALPAILDKERPDLIFYLAGADPHEDDVLGDFSLTMQGLERRDALVASQVRKRDIPLAVLTAGGYPKRFQDVVTIHTQTARVLAEMA